MNTPTVTTDPQTTSRVLRAAGVLREVATTIEWIAKQDNLSDLIKLRRALRLLHCGTLEAGDKLGAALEWLDVMEGE